MAKSKIICIDDAKEVINFLKTCLELEGYDVEVAYDGKEGLKKIEDGKYDVVITDLKMPKMDGWELCESLKNSDTTKNIPIIALSILSPEPLKKPKADIHLIKPFDFSDLKKEIEHLINR